MNATALKIANATLRVLLGLVFLASGYLKLFPIEAFEYNFVSVGVANWTTAPLLARLLIGAEFGLGVFLIFNVWLRRFTLPAVLAMLAFFTLYLLYQIITVGDDGNCGCFGEYLEMTPSESIIKNAMMAGVAVWLLLTRAQFQLPRLPAFLRDRFVGTALALVSLVLPFVLNQVDWMQPSQMRTNDEVGYRLPLDKLYGDGAHTKPSVDVRTGKHVLALFSLKCSHCKTTALKMNVMHKRRPELPFYYLLRGDEETRLQPFLLATQYGNVPYSFYNEDDFFVLSGGAVPAVYWLENDTVVKTENQFTLNEDSIAAWLQRP